MRAAVINAVVGKLVNVLRFRAREPELVHRAVRLLMELATGPVQRISIFCAK